MRRALLSLLAFVALGAHAAGVVNPPFIAWNRTAAEIAAGVNPPSANLYPPGHILRYIPRAEHAAILAGTSTYDASTNAQNWLNSLRAGDTATIIGTVRAQGLQLDTSDITFDGGGWIRPLTNTASSILTIGDDSPDVLVRRIRGQLKLGDITDNYTSWTNVNCLTIVRATELALDLDVTACAVGLELAPTESAVAYNEYTLGLVYNNQIGIRFNPSGTGYTNANTFLKGRFSAGNALVGTTLRGIQATAAGGGGGAPDDNVFYSPTFESAGVSIEISEGDLFRVHSARLEPNTSGTFADEFITLGTNSTRNHIDFDYNNDLFSAGRVKAHGAGTRVDDYNFTIAGDLRKWFYPGAVVQLTVSGVVRNATVRTSTFGATTSVFLYQPVVTVSPTACNTARITNLGTGNRLALDKIADATLGFDVSAYAEDRRYHNFGSTAFTMRSLGTDAPAITLARNAANTDVVLRTVDSTGTTGTILADGTSTLTPTFGQFTMTLTGCTANPTATAEYYITGNGTKALVTLMIPSMSCTSNATTATLTGLPAAIQPTAQGGIQTCAPLRNNSASVHGDLQLQIGSPTLITLGVTCASHGSAFTAAGTKGTDGGGPIVITYPLN